MSKKSSVAKYTTASAEQQVINGSVELGGPCHQSPAVVDAKMVKQTSKESLHRRNTECEVYDDGTNTFFWWVSVESHEFVVTMSSRLNERRTQVTSTNNKHWGLCSNVLHCLNSIWINLKCSVAEIIHSFIHYRCIRFKIELKLNIKSTQWLELS